MSEIPMVGGIFLDSDNRVTLLQRKDHNQLELPGGRFEDAEVAMSALGRTIHMSMGIDIKSAHKISAVPGCNPMRYRQADQDYKMELWQVTNYEGIPWIMEPHLYKEEMVKADLFGRRALRLNASPLLSAVIHALQNEDLTLEK